MVTLKRNGTPDWAYLITSMNRSTRIKHIYVYIYISDPPQIRPKKIDIKSEEARMVLLENSRGPHELRW